MTRDVPAHPFKGHLLRACLEPGLPLGSEPSDMKQASPRLMSRPSSERARPRVCLLERRLLPLPDQTGISLFLHCGNPAPRGVPGM